MLAAWVVDGDKRAGAAPRGPRRDGSYLFMFSRFYKFFLVCFGGEGRGVGKLVLKGKSILGCEYAKDLKSGARSGE